MHGRKLSCVLTATLCLSLSGGVFAATGPMQTPLKVASIYTNNATGALYVSFQAGSMPGCYSGAGGYLYTTNTYYKELYAQLLTMVATGGIQAAVIYTPKAAPTNNWDDCTIEGIYLLPQ
jgi:hypothetical protein